MPPFLALPMLESVQAVLEREVDVLERWMAFWTALVAVGLLYEYLYDLHVFGRANLRAATWIGRLAHLGAFLVTLGVAGELYVEVVAAPAQENLRSFENGAVAVLNKQANVAHQMAEEANERAWANEKVAEQLRNQAEGLRETAEKERLARIRIEESIAWRRISEETQSEIVPFLISPGDHSVSLWFAVGDKEAETFATDIAATFHRASWKVFKPASEITLAGEGVVFPDSSLGNNVGVLVGGPDPLRDRIIGVLVAHGFDAGRMPVSMRKEDEAGEFVIKVLVRPEGPQGDAKLRALANIDTGLARQPP